MGTAASWGSRFGRAERISLLVASIWSIVLIVAAIVAPAYQTQTQSSSGGAAITGSATLVQVNGWRALLVVGAPLLCTVLVGAWLGHRRGKRGAGSVAWATTALLAAFNLLTMSSIGVFVLPVTGALAIACGRHRGVAVLADS